MSTKIKVVMVGVLITSLLAIVIAVGQIKQPVTIFPHVEVFQRNKTIIKKETKNEDITVSSPNSSQTVGKSFTITGKARVFENVVSLRVTNTRNNKVYVLAVTDAKAPDVGKYGEYRYTINLSKTSLADVKPQDKLLLEVFDNSAKDGSEIDKVSIPLIFK